ncbi:MAG: hypothetical protein RL398_975 [Planctomycetota bacterium]|jgi:hypothetical protein
MSQDKAASIENRRDPRYDLDREVALEISADAIVGPGQNISQQGVFFTAQTKVPVTVRIAGRAEPIPGELVRFESMGGGRVGIAVRFDAPLADPLDPAATRP